MFVIMIFIYKTTDNLFAMLKNVENLNFLLKLLRVYAELGSLL